MPFSPNVREAFSRWIRTSTWYKSHPNDEQRFYKFVWAVIVYSRRRPTEQELQQEIIAYWTGRFDSTQLEQFAHQYASLYEHLYTFGKFRRQARYD